VSDTSFLKMFFSTIRYGAGEVRKMRGALYKNRFKLFVSFQKKGPKCTNIGEHFGSVT